MGTDLSAGYGVSGKSDAMDMVALLFLFVVHILSLFPETLKALNLGGCGRAPFPFVYSSDVNPWRSLMDFSPSINMSYAL